MPFGCHVSISGGVATSFARGEGVGCETMQIFTKSQRQWKSKPYSQNDISSFFAEQERTAIQPVVVHSSYLLNLASPKDDLWQKSMAGLADELHRCALIGAPYVVLHPGAHTDSGEEAGIRRVAEALTRVFADDHEQLPGQNGSQQQVMVLLETTAGQGTTLGWKFEHLAQIMERVPYPERLGVCIDTCHIFAAGYDIRTADTYEVTFAAFDSVVGNEHIRVFHLNDSQHDLGSRRDRHEHIGKGCLGEEAFRLLVNDPRFLSFPMILETPKGDDMAEDVENLTLLRSLRSIA